MASQTARETVTAEISRLTSALRDINSTIHQDPELNFEEHIAHDTLSAFLESQGFAVTRHAYGLQTSFEAYYSPLTDNNADPSCRTVTFCAEYDALPSIGHACGHNLIAVSSLAAFIGLAKAMTATPTTNTRIRLLGTPAEEGGGGKILLLNAGAFPSPSPSIALMTHPVSLSSFQLHEKFDASVTGLAGFRCIASHHFTISFFGKAAHAGGEPWNGVNALDAAVMAYSNIAMLKQRIRADERVNAIILEGGTSTAIIPEFTRMECGVRAPSLERREALFEKVKGCFEGAGKAMGCRVEITTSELPYADLKVNRALCSVYVEEMAEVGEGEHVVALTDFRRTVSTDMGNVSYAVPSFHGLFGIPAPEDVHCHNARFTEASGTAEAFAAALRCGRGMAMLGWRFLNDREFAQATASEFEGSV